MGVVWGGAVVGGAEPEPELLPDEPDDPDGAAAAAGATVVEGARVVVVVLVVVEVERALACSVSPSSCSLLRASSLAAVTPSSWIGKATANTTGGEGTTSAGGGSGSLNWTTRTPRTAVTTVSANRCDERT